MTRINTPTNILNDNQFVAHMIKLTKKECKLESDVIPRVKKQTVNKILGIDIID